MESGNLQLPGHKVVVGSSCGPNLEDPLNNCFGFGIGIGSNQNNHHANTNITSSTTTTSSSTPPLNYEIGLMVSNSSSASTTSHKSCDEQSRSNNNNNNNNLINNDNNIMSSTSSSSNSIMVHDLASLIPNWTHNNHSSSSYDIMQIPKHISQSFPKFTELLNSPSSTNLDDYNHFLLNDNNKDQHHHHHHHHHHNHPLFSALSSRCQINGRDHHHHHHLDDEDEDDDEIIIPEGAGLFNGHYSNDDNRGQFSHIHPSVNTSNYLNGNNNNNNSSCHQYYTSMMRPNGLMDHLAQPQPGLNDNVGLAVFGSDNSFGLVVGDPIQQPHDRFSCSRNTQRISSLSSEMREIEKQSIMERRSSHQLAMPIKKSRLESRAPSCPPFKVRKEKLGDRIAALQQLVSPFGKTDTASVLMEAIGYIKFLQNQVETLSVPYMKSIRHKSIKAMQRGVKDEESYVEEQTKRDLRSRGLCLVPLSCMSYVTAGDQGGGATIWPPPTFGGTSFY